MESDENSNKGLTVIFAILYPIYYITFAVFILAAVGWFFTGNWMLW